MSHLNLQTFHLCLPYEMIKTPIPSALLNIPKQCVKRYLERLGINAFKFTSIFVFCIFYTPLQGGSLVINGAITKKNGLTKSYKWDQMGNWGYKTLLIGLITPTWGPPCIYAIFLWTFSPAVSPPCETKKGSIWEVEISWSSVVGAPTSRAFARPSELANQPEKSSFGKKKT